jgi:aspartate 1-decarboxylase
MLIEMLKSKIHRATVTEANLNYEGSLGIDTALLERAGILPGEKVQLVNITNGARLVTYAIAGAPGEICLNGAAARLGEIGDKVIILTYCQLDAEEARSHTPVIVHVDETNRFVAS